MSLPDPSDVLQAWQESAHYWDKNRAVIERMFAPLTTALIEEAHIGAGQLLLDVGGGTGEPSLTIASVVGIGGLITCTDPVAAMISLAEQESRRRGLTNLKFQQCAAECLPFPNSSFDAALCRLGAMFFRDPVTASREMRRVTKPEGHISFVVWAANEVNPFFRVVTNVLDRYVESTPADPDAPGAFRFSAPGKLAAVLQAAGVREVEERSLEFRIEAPVSLEEFWNLRVELSDTLREKVKRLSANRLVQVKREVEESASDFFNGNSMSFPAQARVVTGLKQPHVTQIVS